MKYIYAQFELVQGDKKQLGYGIFEPYHYHSYVFYKINNAKSDKNIITTEYIQMLASNSNIQFDEINLITMLNKEIDTKFLIHFPIVLDQNSNLELKINVDKDKFILFDNSDYESDESEHIFSLIRYEKEEEFVFITECIKDIWHLPEDTESAKKILEGALERIKYELNDFGSVEFWDDTTEEEKEDYKKSLTKCLPWMTDKIKEITNKPTQYEESFVKSKTKIINEKINFYRYLNRNKLLDDKTCSIKIANQMLRKEKLADPEKFKYNFVIKEFSYNKERNGMKHYNIQFANETEELEGVFTFDKTGYYSCSGYKSKMEINFEPENDLDKEYFIEIFQGDLFNELFNHSSGDDNYDNCECGNNE